MRRLQSIHLSGTLLGFILALILAVTLVALLAPPAHGATQSPAGFHIAEITKVLVGFNGDTDIQAVEIKMTAAGENFVSAMEIATYDGNGVKLATLGTFTVNLPNGLTGDNILCATAKFQTTFPTITPDLIITPGIPVTSGQVVYEKVGCRVNALPYGAVTTPLTSPTVAPPLPAQGATVLVRTVDTPTSPFCPHSEDAANRFGLRSGSLTNPIVFRNNARQTVTVFSTVTGTDGSPPSPVALRIWPNPFRGSTLIEAPDWRPLSIYDIRGRLVRILTCVAGGPCPAVAGPFRGEWDGTDGQGRDLPSGIYFLRYAGAGGVVVTRIALMR